MKDINYIIKNGRFEGCILLKLVSYDDELVGRSQIKIELPNKHTRTIKLKELENDVEMLKIVKMFHKQRKPKMTYNYLKEHKDIPIVEVTLWNDRTKDFKGSYYYANVDKHLLLEGSYAQAPVKRPAEDKWYIPCKILNTNVNLEYAKDTIMGACEGYLEVLGNPIDSINGMQ